MTEAGAGAPTAATQISGLTFALLLLDPEMAIREANPAAEDLLGISARRLRGLRIDDVVAMDEGIFARMSEPDAQLTARGVPMTVGERKLQANLTVSGLTSHPGWRVLTLSDAGQGERLADDERPAPLRGPAILAHEIKNPLAAIRGAA